MCMSIRKKKLGVGVWSEANKIDQHTEVAVKVIETDCKKNQMKRNEDGNLTMAIKKEKKKIIIAGINVLSLFFFLQKKNYERENDDASDHL